MKFDFTLIAIVRIQLKRMPARAVGSGIDVRERTRSWRSTMPIACARPKARYHAFGRGAGGPSSSFLEQLVQQNSSGRGRLAELEQLAQPR